MKRRYLVMLVAFLVICVFALSGCDLIDRFFPGDNDSIDANEKQYKAIYSLYLENAEESGEVPLSYEEWLNSIKGRDGKDGQTPTIGYNGNWWIDNVDTGVPAIGKDGINGLPGQNGNDGVGIVNIVKISADGLVDTYEISYSDGSSSTFKVTNGKDGLDGVGIKKIDLTEKGELLITYTDGTTETVAIGGGDNCSHDFGEWKKHLCLEEFYVPSCEQVMFYRVCSVCSHIEWREGSYDDHVFETVYEESTCEHAGFEAKVCIVCEYIESYEEFPTVDHSYSNQYSSNDYYHWNECIYCYDQINNAEHDYNSDGICVVCGNPEPSLYPWEKTSLIFQMTDNSNKQELPSTCRRYLAGDRTGVADQSIIDTYITERNESALKEVNVEVTYQYLPDTDAYIWAENINTITEEVYSQSKMKPDIYCNFVYDMVAASLQKAFANLYSTTMYEDDHELAGAEHNYFEFTDPTFVDSGEGYMIEYMKSLTLSKWKMYCLASDYLIDLVRAELIVPVNIDLLESLSTSDDPDMAHLKDRVTTLDENGNVETNYTIEDFYQLVYDREWNYETLAKFSATVFEEGESGDESIDLRDTVGFAVPCGTGLAATGLLYSSSVSIVEKIYDPYIGDYVYSYPYLTAIKDSDGNVTSFGKDPDGTHDELIAFCNNLNTLFNTTGVIAVDPADTFGFGEGTDLTAIRERFSTGNVLFGGIICLGSLEYDEYKEMNGQGKKGYGIAPVPLYRTNYVENGETKVDRYNTQIHNLGKVISISYRTDNFAQCTAYLNYMSTHSTEILNEYYDYKLQYDVVGTGVKGNVEMLKYIRKNVRSSFDKAFEDALGRFYNATNEASMKEQWHTMIKDAKYKFTGMDEAYASVTPKKADRLYNLETVIFPGLPE